MRKNKDSKIKLKDLKVESFITGMSEEIQTVKGGGTNFGVCDPTMYNTSCVIH